MSGSLYVWLMYVASRPFNSVSSRRGAAAAEAAAARLIMRATLAIKATEAISNVARQGAEGEWQRARGKLHSGSRYRRKIAATFSRARSGPARASLSTLKCNFCGYIC